MNFHLHIRGRVQGVGYRPYIFKHASGNGINGTVTNGNDGVHVVFNHHSMSAAETFAKEIIENAPSHAVIQDWKIVEVNEEEFDSFKIMVREDKGQPDLLISPDFAFCDECQKEFHDPSDRRYHYPFITCTLCGPRYSIIEKLPYERHLTAMQKFIPCAECQEEYNDVSNRRFFSQTNSCPACGIQLSLHTPNGRYEADDPESILEKVVKSFHEGCIVAVKGIGGFLLMCDANNTNVIKILRSRKHRPRKPFAVLFPDIKMVSECTHLHKSAIDVLNNEASPVVLLDIKPEINAILEMQSIAPGLSSVGVMIPYAPILEWIASGWKKPLIATSANISGSSIIFQTGDKDELFQLADFILDHDRDICIPQDDSVVRFAEGADELIILRRSRGMAPAINIKSDLKSDEVIFAAGAMLKSAFAFKMGKQVYLSQYMGNLLSYDALQNYEHTFDHFTRLLKVQPQFILTDLHPDYPSTQFAEQYGKEWNVPIKKIQHHEAHFAAILGEHDLFEADEKILGVIWDGSGLGFDSNIQGGEFFIYEKGKIERVHYIEPFNNLAGDKIANEPRLAALAIAGNNDDAAGMLESKFSQAEWRFYKKALAQKGLQNSSVGRYFDGVASLLDLVNINTYEGEAALVLEQCAHDFIKNEKIDGADHYFNSAIDQPIIPMKHIINRIMNDIKSGIKKSQMAARFHMSLVHIIDKVAVKYGVKSIAFSGGVFQNAVLINSVYLLLAKSFRLYIHRQLPPNDECISFGQIMHHLHIKTV